MNTAMPGRALLVVLPSVLFGLNVGMLVRSMTRHWVTVPAWRRFLGGFAPAAAISGGLLLALAPTNAWVGAATIVLLAAGIAFAQGWPQSMLRGIVIRTRSRLAAEAVSDPELLPLDSPLPPLIRARIDDLKAVGFALVKAGRYERGGVNCILFRDDDSVTAEVYSHPRSDSQVHVDLELTSVLADRSGLLTTGTSGHAHYLWGGELAQVFPGAPPEQLLLYHERARSFLAEQGLLVQVVAPDEVLHYRSWGLSVMQAAAARTPREEMFRATIRVARREPANIGPIEDNPEALRRLAALRGDSG